jgi:Acetyltransferase (GNAT) domain
MSVAHDDGRVVGVAAHSLYRMVLSGKERLATFSVHATTDPVARGKGVFVGLERKHEEEAKARGAAVVLAFASAPTAPLFLGPLGWTPVGKLRVWARPLPRVALRHGGQSRLERFALGGDAAAAWPNHIVRDAEYLNWRYLDSPRDYVAYGADGGYAVLGHKRHKGHPIALVADLVGPVRPLLRACVAGVRPGTRALFGLPGAGETAAYASCGFVPTPMTLDFMGKALAGQLDRDPRAWRFTLGDTDFF